MIDRTKLLLLIIFSKVDPLVDGGELLLTKFKQNLTLVEMETIYHYFGEVHLWHVIKRDSIGLKCPLSSMSV